MEPGATVDEGVAPLGTAMDDDLLAVGTVVSAIYIRNLEVHRAKA